NITFRESDGRALINIIKTRTQANPEGKGTKTPSSERIIPIDDKGTQLMKFVMKEAAEIKKDSGEILHQDDFIFINQRTNEPFHVSYINTLMKSISIQCGIKANPHMMRHTFATETRLSGADARSVADYLGHKSEIMTDHYTHATAEGMDNVVNFANSRLH
ncbi:MAG: site-specific integrase, partial [Carnobacterium jeotgali]|uniref:tyrosine-type recombinase/integrase n=1 Tax=Carnobacterium jeotgali TaxID=545534 RepID=UPI003C7419B7